MDPTEALVVVGRIFHVSRKSGDLVTESPSKTARAVRVVCPHWESHERGIVTPEISGVPAWPAYEMNVLRLGTALAAVMKKTGLWRQRSDVLDAAAEVLADPRYGRGRRSFAILLGEHGAQEYGAALAGVLTDVDLAGYAIKSLSALGSGEHVIAVRAIATEGRPWVKNAAERYLAQFETTKRVRARGALASR